MIQLVAFLGNYGREYEGTRHNVAWLFEESLPFAQRLAWQNKFKGHFSSVDGAMFERWAGEILAEETNLSAAEKIYFLKPYTYMNASGESIGELARFFKIKPEETIVVHDELELAPGTISLKWGGGLGGHNGLRSTKAAFGTADFWRLRFGIGRPSHPDVAGYVLSRFGQDELATLNTAFQKAARLVAKALTTGRPESLIKDWGKVLADS